MCALTSNHPPPPPPPASAHVHTFLPRPRRYGAWFGGLSPNTVYTVTVHSPLSAFSTTWSTASTTSQTHVIAPKCSTFLCNPFAELASVAGVGDTGKGNGAAWVDFDGDGDDDLYVANDGEANKLYRNNGNGTFTDLASAAGVADTGKGRGPAWGDYDNDGDQDLYVSNYGQANLLYRNNGDGTFTDVTSAAGVGDTGNGFGTSWGDYDGDGDLDLHVANSGQANKLYRNNGDDTFTDVTTAAGVGDTGNSQGSSWGDYDDDGDLDLYVANVGQANKLYRNNGDGTFTDVTTAAGVGDTGGGRGMAWVDYDNDGDLDLYVANYGQANLLYRNNADGTFTDVASAAGVADTGDSTGPAWTDVNSDGHLDLYQVNYGQANKLYRNNADGTFTDMTTTAGVGDTGKGGSSSWGDYDNDGDLDLYVSNEDKANVLYRNAFGVFSPALAVKPITGTSALSIFSSVKLSTANGKLVALRALDGGSGRCSQSG